MCRGRAACIGVRPNQGCGFDFCEWVGFCVRIVHVLHHCMHVCWSASPWNSPCGTRAGAVQGERVGGPGSHSQLQ